MNHPHSDLASLLCQLPKMLERATEEAEPDLGSKSASQIIVLMLAPDKKRPPPSFEPKDEDEDEEADDDSEEVM